MCPCGGFELCCSLTWVLLVGSSHVCPSGSLSSPSSAYYPGGYCSIPTNVVSTTNPYQ